MRSSSRRPLPNRAAPWLRTAPPWAHAPAQAHAAAAGGHPLADATVSAALHQRALAIEAAFAAIEPTLRALAPLQFEADFPARARALLAERLGVEPAAGALQTRWTAPLDMRALYAHCVLETFCQLVERAFDRSLSQRSEGESAEALIRRWGFHAIDITPCADGRLSGVVDYILRVPPAIVAHRRSHAGALFDVEAALQRWEGVELGRWREGRPNPADAPTRYLKIGVYHFSSLAPATEGCAAHGSDAGRAAAALLERLGQFAAAVEQVHCCGARVATLLIGVDTDTDAIRVHVPDAAGRMDAARWVDNATLYAATGTLGRDAAKEAIRVAVADCAGVAPDEPGSAGMRWLCAYLLKNNLAQVDAVRHWYGGSYPDRGHTERLIVVGDAVDDVQLRNLAFQAQMETVEEGAADLDVGLRILAGLHGPRDLAVPVLVHCRFDARIPGASARAEARAQRLGRAIQARHAELSQRGLLHVHAVLRAGDSAQLIRLPDPQASGPTEYYG